MTPERAAFLERWKGYRLLRDELLAALAKGNPDAEALRADLLMLAKSFVEDDLGTVLSRAVAQPEPSEHGENVSRTRARRRCQHAGSFDANTVLLGGNMGDGNRRVPPSVHDDDSFYTNPDKYNDE